VRITVIHTPSAVELDISDDGCGPKPDAAVERAAGHGLIGMRERLAVYGGDLHAGEGPGGGFQVSARIPIDEVRPA
jgi:signal transduction histidine kinase